MDFARNAPYKTAWLSAAAADVLRRAGHHAAAFLAAARPHIDHIICVADHIQVVKLDDDHVAPWSSKVWNTPSSVCTSSG